MDAVALAGLAGLALIDSTSFGTLVVPTMMLVQPRLRVGHVAAYLVTIGVFYLVLGVALLAGAAALRSAMAGVDDALSSTPAYVAQAVIGVLLIALSFRYDAGPAARRKAARGGQPTRVERWRAAAFGEHATSRAVVTLALGAGVIEAASMVPYLAAIAIITTSGLGFGWGATILVAYVGVMLLPAALLLAARLAAGARAEGTLEKFHDWIVRLTGGTLGWILGIAGFLLASDAITVLWDRGFFGR